MSGTTISKTKSSIGSTSVHLRYHTPEEYDTLTIKQKDELHAWRKNNQGNKKGTGRDGKDAKTTSFKASCPTKTQVSSAVAKELKKLAKQANAQPAEDDVDVQIATLVKDAILSKKGQHQLTNHGPLCIPSSNRFAINDGVQQRPSPDYHR